LNDAASERKVNDKKEALEAQAAAYKQSTADMQQQKMRIEQQAGQYKQQIDEDPIILFHLEDLNETHIKMIVPRRRT